jgi:hypothetical protein
LPIADWSGVRLIPIHREKGQDDSDLISS